ncbi:hypothetical protein KC622_01690 [Candidatus Dojkabacteria bacterium]|uniref:Uncharacterized protein n=1 Tax=Candidatus Dojkabacteria bacterium TaxID=2099670 RepID=A0A955I1T8_9BACT|nr:hypothetical protein [Candidatus Dojkabacteria bacterium]
MYKREIKRFANRYGKFLEPFAILAMIALFILPIASVLNLSIGFKQNDSVKQEVLGVTSDSKVLIEKVGGTHPVVYNEKLIQTSENVYEYSTYIRKRATGSYDKPILTITNNTLFDQEITFTLNKSDSTDTLIGVLYNRTNYFLSAPDGETYSHTLKLSPGQSMPISITLRNNANVLFDDSISIGIKSATKLYR